MKSVEEIMYKIKRHIQDTSVPASVNQEEYKESVLKDCDTILSFLDKVTSPKVLVLQSNTLMEISEAPTEEQLRQLSGAIKYLKHKGE